MGRRGVLIAALAVLLGSFLQSPGRIAADTKLDLTADPVGFLSRASHLWTSTAPMGQVQNQAYGYFFPHGAFFALGHLADLPPWVTQRLWWALLLTVGFVGIVRLAEALAVGSPGSRVLAGVVFVLSPRVLTTLGSISSETLPMMLAPWVLVPAVRALSSSESVRTVRPLWARACASAMAIALMGAVNAVATLAAVGVTVVWVAAQLLAEHGRRRRVLAFCAWWAGAAVLACAWWVVPLLILSRTSPDFLDFIESSRVTTEWTSLMEVLRGTSSWTPFVSGERVAGAVLVTEPAAVLATGTLAAAGLAGLCMRQMPFRRRWVAILVVGLLLMCAGFAGGLGSPIAEGVRAFLDGPGAFLRNIHKFEPFLRLPLVLGLAHLLARVPFPGAVSWRTESWRNAAAAFAHPQRSRPVAAALVVLVAVIGAGSLFWTGQTAPEGAYSAIPDYWKQTATWLSQHRATPGAAPTAAATRALVVPGAPSADQLWGLTRDEPLQGYADTPWTVRDAIPLTPAGAIRAMDSVQRDIADGTPSAGLAATLAQQGIGYVVLRADLDPQTSRSARPLLAQQTLTHSPGLTRAATFGPPVSAPTPRGVVRDSGMLPPMPAVQIFAVHAPVAFDGTGPSLVDTDSVPRVAGGPESLATLQDLRARTGHAPLGPAVLRADADAAGLSPEPVTLTDTPTDRETDFGRVDDHNSAIRAPGDPRRTQNAAPDYPVTGQPAVQGQWLLNNQPGRVSVTTSGSASDATEPGQSSPANSPAAAFDADPTTAWVSSGLDAAVGKSMRLRFDRPTADLALTLTTAKALGPDVDSVLISTESGSTVVHELEPGKPVTVTAPSGPTRWVQIRAIGTSDGTAGNQFALGDVSVSDLATHTPLTIRHRVALPPVPPGTAVRGWALSQQLPGHADCLADDTPGRAPRTRCAPGLGLAPETPSLFTRVLSVPSATSVAPTMLLRPRPGAALNTLLSRPGVTAHGDSSVNDPRGSAAAAVDGDPGTVWTAPDTSADHSGDRERKRGKPSLTVDLPAPQRVEHLQIVAPHGYPSPPTRVAVDLGTGPQVRDVHADGSVDLTPATTDHIRIEVRKQRGLIDVDDLGFSHNAPPGIAEIRVTPTPPMLTAPDPDRMVQVGCAAGIGITVSGTVIGMSVSTTEGDLRAGRPVVARPCSPDPALLGPGEQELTANPGSAFSVDSIGLDAVAPGGTTTAGPAASTAGPPAAQQDSTASQEHLHVDDWSSSHRTATVPAGPKQRILVVPESTNGGWRASLGDKALQPVVVNGWQQGWVVPAGAGGTVTLTYRFDSLYRWSLLVGLILVGVLAVLTMVGVRRRGRSPVDETLADDSASDDHGRAPGVAATVAAYGGWLAASWVVSGWWGLLVSVVIGSTVTLCARRFRAPVNLTVVGVFVAMMLAVIGLTTGPWHASSGYHGFDWWVQLPAFVAVSLLMFSCLPTDPLRRWRR